MSFGISVLIVTAGIWAGARLLQISHDNHQRGTTAAHSASMNGVAPTQHTK